MRMIKLPTQSLDLFFTIFYLLITTRFQQFPDLKIFKKISLYIYTPYGLFQDKSREQKIAPKTCSKRHIFMLKNLVIQRNTLRKKEIVLCIQFSKTFYISPIFICIVPRKDNAEKLHPRVLTGNLMDRLSTQEKCYW